MHTVGMDRRRQRRQRGACLLCGLISLGHCGTAAAAAPPLRLGTQDRAPYAYRADGAIDGIAVRVVACALNAARQPYAISMLPWERVQIMSKIDELDAFFPASARPDRAAGFVASVAIADQHWAWYLPANSPLDPASPQFKQLARVGAHFGSARLAMLDSEHYRVSFTPQSDRQLLQGFMAGRADAILGADQTLAYAARELKLDASAFKVVIVKNTPQFVFFSKTYVARNPGVLERFNAGVPGCRKPPAAK